VKTHHFILGVKTHKTRKSAELAVLASFASHKPNGYEFCLRDMHKEEWMAGAQSGMETTLELVARYVENLRKTCDVPFGLVFFHNVFFLGVVKYFNYIHIFTSFHAFDVAGYSATP
jgi:hypothetical protein